MHVAELNVGNLDNKYCLHSQFTCSTNYTFYTYVPICTPIILISKYGVVEHCMFVCAVTPSNF